MRLRLARQQPGAGFLGQPCEQRCLAAGPCTHVEPWPVGGLGSGQRKGHQLRAFILDAGAPFAHRLHQTRNPLSNGPERRVVRRRSVQLLDARKPRSDDERRYRRDVVRREGLLQFILRQGFGERLHDPCRVVSTKCLLGCGFQALGELVEPLLHALRRDLAEDGVDEAGNTVTDALLGEFDGRVDGSMCRNAHAEDLVGSQAEHVDDRRLQRLQETASGALDDAVVGAHQAAGTGDEFRGEGRVTGGRSAGTGYPGPGLTRTPGGGRASTRTRRIGPGVTHLRTHAPGPSRLDVRGPRLRVLPRLRSGLRYLCSGQRVRRR